MTQLPLVAGVGGPRPTQGLDTGSRKPPVPRRRLSIPGLLPAAL